MLLFSQCLSGYLTTSPNTRDFILSVIPPLRGSETEEGYVSSRKSATLRFQSSIHRKTELSSGFFVNYDGSPNRHINLNTAGTSEKRLPPITNRYRDYDLRGLRCTSIYIRRITGCENPNRDTIKTIFPPEGRMKPEGRRYTVKWTRKLAYLRKPQF